MTTISNLVVVAPSEPNFLQIFPQAIAYAEDRLYRELDLLSTVTRDSGQLVAGNRNFTLPQTKGRFVVTNGLNLITPSGVTTPDLGTRTQMLPVSRDFLDNVGGSSNYTGTPANYAMVTDQDVIVGPMWPDAGYTIEVIGTIQPAPISASNTSTYLSLYLPDLLVAAVMIFMTGYQQNFGSQADNPQMSVSWSSEYDKLFASANVIQQRQRYAAGAWSSLSPAPVATPSR